MDRDQLRRAQAPLRETFRSDPSAALTVVGAAGAFREDGITCTVVGWAGPVRAGCIRTPVGMDVTPARGTCSCKRCWPVPE